MNVATWMGAIGVEFEPFVGLGVNSTISGAYESL